MQEKVSNGLTKDKEMYTPVVAQWEVVEAILKR
jgi:hypothetical protein